MDTDLYNSLEKMVDALDQQPPNWQLMVVHIQHILDHLENNGAKNQQLLSVNRFIMDRILFDDRLQQQTKMLPDKVQVLIADMGMHLHDAASSPSIAKMFQSTLADLRRRVSELRHMDSTYYSDTE